MNSKLEKLNRLNKLLKAPKELGGLFLPKNSKKQFITMFIAEMPSMNEPKGKSNQKENFNFDVTKRDKFLQEMMLKYGVAGSYITDIVKERDLPRKPTGKEIKKWLQFLLKEIKIIKPKNIIVLGRRTYEDSFKPYVEPKLPKDIRVNWVYHYSNQVQRHIFERRFKKIIKWSMDSSLIKHF